MSLGRFRGWCRQEFFPASGAPGTTRAGLERFSRSGRGGGLQACAHARAAASPGAARRPSMWITSAVTAWGWGDAGSAGGGSRSSRCRGRRCGSRCRGGGRDRAALRIPGVRAVEAGALENHAHAVELLAQGTLAFRAGRQGAVRKRLDDVEGMAAILAGVSICRHWCSSSWANERSRTAGCYPLAVTGPEC